MAPTLRGRGFRPLGALAGDRLGLPAGRGRELLLAEAWRRAAGDAIASRAPVLRVRRGVLELELRDPQWAEPLRELIPRLAGRLSAARPELGVRRVRLVRPGQLEATTFDLAPQNQ